MHWDIIVTLVVAVFGSTGFWAFIQNRSKQKSAEVQLIKGIAYSEIIRRCEHYINRGCISTNEYNDLNKYLFEPYRALEGDGTAEKLMKEVRELPTEKEAA